MPCWQLWAGGQAALGTTQWKLRQLKKTLFVFVVKTHRTVLQMSNRMMASAGTDGEWARLLCISGVLNLYDLQESSLAP